MNALFTDLKVSIECPGVSLQLEGWEDQLVEGTAVPVDEVEELSVVRPGLQVAGKQTEGGVLVDLYPELEILAEPHHVGRVAGPPDHPHPHPGGGGRVGHHVRPGGLEGDPAINQHE